VSAVVMSKWHASGRLHLIQMKAFI